jgi:hypothetical protein
VGFVMFRCLVFSGSNRSANLTMAETSFKLEHPLGSFSFPFVSSVFFLCFYSANESISSNRYSRSKH